MRVLLLEDDKSTLRLLELHLSRAGHEVSGTPDPGIAAMRLAIEDFDWLVVDGQLGRVDGREFAAAARRLRPSLRVAMVSGYYDAADISGGPIERLFPKPVDTDALSSFLSVRRPS